MPALWQIKVSKVPVYVYACIISTDPFSRDWSFLKWSTAPLALLLKKAASHYNLLWHNNYCIIIQFPLYNICQIYMHWPCCVFIHSAMNEAVNELYLYLLRLLPRKKRKKNWYFAEFTSCTLRVWKVVVVIGVRLYGWEKELGKQRS